MEGSVPERSGYNACVGMYHQVRKFSKKEHDQLQYRMPKESVEGTREAHGLIVPGSLYGMSRHHPSESAFVSFLFMKSKILFYHSCFSTVCAMACW